MNTERPDYFKEPPSPKEALLRRIKGTFRREMIASDLATDPPESIPEAWRSHDILETLKGFLQSAHPHARGGEDLPDLAEGEVEIARLRLVNSVHGEVTSLRARQDPSENCILLSMVDEYSTEITLPKTKFNQSLTAEEVLTIFRDADPSPTDTSCEVEFSSFFYPGLDALAEELGIKPNT